MDQLRQLLERIGNLDATDVNFTDWLPLLAVLTLSAAAALCLSLLYAVFFERRATGSDIHRAFPALGLAITAIFICLQHSLPMSLGLLGALSIVRFRTPVKEPEEIGFLMVLIACSICCATLEFTLLAIVLSLTVGVLLALRFLPWFRVTRGAAASVVISTSADRDEADVTQLLELAQSSSHRAALDGVADCDGVRTVTLRLYRGTASSLASLHRSLKEACPNSEVSVFVHDARPGRTG